MQPWFRELGKNRLDPSVAETPHYSEDPSVAETPHYSDPIIWKALSCKYTSSLRVTEESFSVARATVAQHHYVISRASVLLVNYLNKGGYKKLKEPFNWLVHLGMETNSRCRGCLSHWPCSSLGQWIAVALQDCLSIGMCTKKSIVVCLSTDSEQMLKEHSFHEGGIDKECSCGVDGTRNSIHHSPKGTMNGLIVATNNCWPFYLL